MERATLRTLLEQIARNGKSARYPAELREAAVEYLRARRAAGVDTRVVAREIGMVGSTLLRWDALLPEPKAATGPVESAATTPARNDVREEADASGGAALDERAARFRAR